MYKIYTIRSPRAIKCFVCRKRDANFTIDAIIYIYFTLFAYLFKFRPSIYVELRKTWPCRNFRSHESLRRSIVSIYERMTQYIITLSLKPVFFAFSFVFFSLSFFLFEFSIDEFRCIDSFVVQRF